MTTDSTPDAGLAPLDGQSHPLDAQWVRYRRHVGWIRSAVAAVILLGAAAVAVWGVRLPLLPCLGAALALLAPMVWLTQWWPTVAYRHATFRVTAEGMELRHGVLWRSLVHVPRSRIQHSDVSQGPVERRYGLGTLSIFTAGTAHSRVRLRGLAHADALRIRDYLTQAHDDDVV